MKLVSTRRLGAVMMTVLLAACSPAASPSAAPPSEPAATPPGSPTASGAASAPAVAPPSGEPIVVGSTLSLTGAFGATGVIHRLVGEQFVEELNTKRGGLLGRPVEWTLLDDESDGAKVTQSYERLISQDQVDLIMGPYGTPNILPAMAVAERFGYVMPQHTAVIAPLLTYECQFPAWSIGTTPNEYVPGLVLDALESLDTPPKTIAVVANQNGSTDFVANGIADDPNDPSVANVAKARGLDVVAEIPYPPTTTEWAPIAAQVRDANPDFVFNSAIGVDTVNLIQAFEQLDYSPPNLFSLFPAPGPLLGVGEAAQRTLSISLFEANEPLLEAAGPDVQAIVETYEANATAEGLPYTTWETQATASWTAWEILVAGVTAAGSLDHEAICDALHASGADTTFLGHLTFDPANNNFWPPDQLIKQIQGDEWVVVWPTDRAAAELQGPPS
ncbi:MAG TPA: amino acid ABC transporter substrate-binding protein [Candidatus Limnocylindrales bacterium]|nr:amino acid ABC transporter substrate-binding protein [Candidatus Limnocylindrales bacterium]